LTLVFVDSSAIVSMVVKESDADELANRLETARSPLTSGLAVFETVLGVMRIHRWTVPRAREAVEEFLEIAGVKVIDISEQDARAALEAFSRFGKGRHRAALNMGDCFSYACASERGIPLLCKGNDFVHTDIELA
jgi:ribonuclease VapC